MLKKILVVDDTEVNIEILLEILSKDYDVLAALDGEMAIEIVKEEKPDLILLDIMMPNMDGYEVCKKLKSKSKSKNIPIIFITAETDEDRIEKAYDMGAVDYVTKPFKPKELLARVNKEIRVQELISSLEASQKELKLLSSTDHLTKLYNRRYLYKTSEHVLDLAKRNNKDLSIVMLDIDNFKKINDTYGHKVGDNAIKKLAEILKKLSRCSDIACRWGGEEFLMLLPNTNIDGAVIIAQKLREGVESLVIDLGESKTISYTVSAGVSEVNIDFESDVEPTIHRADEALYEAKENGKNMVCTKK